MENVKYNYQYNSLCGFLTFPGLPIYFLLLHLERNLFKCFELNLRLFLPKTVPRCQGNCGKKITQNDGMLIKAYGTTRWAGKKTGKETSKYGPVHIHFNKTCLRRHTKKYYRPDERFDYSIIK